uniref:Uncharacterized protein n=1 Tax=Arundo donax TaxID=35708 RepID=A0A0A9HX89_ARUDO
MICVCRHRWQPKAFFSLDISTPCIAFDGGLRHSVQVQQRRLRGWFNHLGGVTTTNAGRCPRRESQFPLCCPHFQAYRPQERISDARKTIGAQ